MYCGNCGTVVQDEDEFCRGCGRQLVRKAKKLPQTINSLWRTGRLWEIFGFKDNSFNSVQLGNKYAELLGDVASDEAVALDEAFAVLNAPESRLVYSKCRLAMSEIENEVGGATFTDAELKLWQALWSYCSSGWREPTTEAVLNAKIEAGLVKAPSKPKEKTQEELIKEVVELIKALDKQGLNKHQIAEVLQQKGMSFPVATQLVDYYFKTKKKNSDSKRGCLVWIVIGLIILGVSSMDIWGGSKPSSNNNVPLTVPPETTVISQDPGMGKVTGRVFHRDGTTPSYFEIYLFKENEYFSYDGLILRSTSTYNFSSVPIGRYEVYVVTDPSTTTVTEPPNAIINVVEYQTITVPNIYVD